MTLKPLALAFALFACSTPGSGSNDSIDAGGGGGPGSGSGDGSGANLGSADDPFTATCGGSGAACAQLALRWTVYSDDDPSSCAALDAGSVTLTAEFQADGRTATLSAACTIGALLTPMLPLGPYALTVTLNPASGTAPLATATAGVTLPAADTVVESDVELDDTAATVIGSGD